MFGGKSPNRHIFVSKVLQKGLQRISKNIGIVAAKPIMPKLFQPWNALAAEGKNEEAISHYKMAIKLNPDYAKAHYNLGIALVAEGKNEEAISHYKMAIKLSPDFAVAHNNLGIALVAEGKNEEAISHYKMAIKLKPD